MKEKLKQIPLLHKFVLNLKCMKSYYLDYKMFIKNYICSKDSKETLEYAMIHTIHSLEKGMTIKDLRPFGKNKIIKLIELMCKYEKITNELNYAIAYSLNILKVYTKIYEEHGWIENEEYKIAINKLNCYTNIPNMTVGAYNIYKEDILKNAMIDYDKFVSSRHSIRSYSKKEITESTIKKALNIAIKSPSACNRQMCKIYNVKDAKKREIVIKYGQGFSNFNLENANIFVITFDIAAFIHYAEKNQGWFNAGLFSMNFVNALHSFGIGSCFIQFGNSHKDEKYLKKILNIPRSERIAVMVSAGYYNAVSRIPCSTRKNASDIYKKV